MKRGVGLLLTMVVLAALMSACGATQREGESSQQASHRTSSRHASVNAAARAISHLPIAVTLRRPPAFRRALLGRVSVSPRGAFRFVVLVGAGGVPRRIPGAAWYASDFGTARQEASILGSTPYVFMADAGRGASSSRARRRELDASYLIEESLCRQAEHQSCPPI